MRSITALYVANGKEFMRDRMAGFFTLLMPVLFAVFFGVVFSGGDGPRLDLGLVNEDVGVVGQQLASGLTSPEAAKMLNVKMGSRDEVLAALNKGSLDVVLVLPANLTQLVTTGHSADVEVYYDQARQSSAGIGLGVARNLLAEANLRVKGLQPPLVVRERAIQTAPLRPVDFYIPSQLAMAMLWLGLFGTAAQLVAQREQQVLRRLSASPVPRSHLLAGQVLWRLTVGLMQTAIFVLVGMLALGVRVQGNWLLFVAAAILGALVFVSMGYLIAGLSRTTESSVALAQVLNFPMMFLSGILFELQVLPSYLRPISHVLPATYLGDAFRQLMVGYSALYPLWLDFAVLAGWLVVFVGLGLRFFRWEQH